MGRGLKMDVRVKDVCVVQGYRLTKYQIFDKGDVVDTFFNIRDGDGEIQGCNYDDIKIPLGLMISKWASKGTDLLSA